MKYTLTIISTFITNILLAQDLKQEDIIGFWKLKEAGFYKKKKKIIKDFDDCRLMRNYTIWDNKLAIYNYIEGSSGDCKPSEPRLTYWRIVENRIQFYIGEQILEENVVKINGNNSITFETYLPKKIIVKGDKTTESILNTISYDILEKTE